MAETWRLILLLSPLIAGAISIFFSFRMMKRYRVPFLGSYFYYMVFLYIFGTYSLAGAGILQHLLARMEIDQKVIHSASLYAIFLGIPFLALAKFMFFRSILDFFQKKPAAFSIIIYFLSFTIVFILYGVYMVRLTRFELGDYQKLMLVQRWIFIAFMFTIYFSAFFYILITTLKFTDLPAKSYIRSFGSWYLVYMILSIATLAIRTNQILARQFFLLIFLSWHLIPILFMNLYLNKYQRKESELPVDFETKLQAFAAEHEISKRECEVVRLICRGLANQEISDSLFISLQTVKDHIHRIFVKTGVKNRVQLTNMLR
jgi:DNA-binding CsgD family transcriptional regulator